MRKLLLWMGTMCVGTVTLVIGLSMLIGAGGSTETGAYAETSSGGATAFFGGVILWLFALAAGVALSAPAFLNPPDSGGIWSFRVPLPLWLFLTMMKLTSWIGFYILLGVWILIFKLWNNHQNNKLPSFSHAPRANQTQPAYGGPPPFTAQPPYAVQQPYAAQHPFPGQQPSYRVRQQFGGPQPYAAQPQPVGASATPASWQADPTGRYSHRWWDGARWTDRVANGSFQTTDSI
jgi:Protein of unknown function (DUF2510)